MPCYARLRYIRNAEDVDAEGKQAVAGVCSHQQIVKISDARH